MRRSGPNACVRTGSIGRWHHSFDALRVCPADDLSFTFDDPSAKGSPSVVFNESLECGLHGLKFFVHWFGSVAHEFSMAMQSV